MLAPSIGVPVWSATRPRTDAVVTPWALNEVADRTANPAAAARARDARTMQRMVGPLLRRNGRKGLRLIDRRNWTPCGGPSRMLGLRFTQQIHGGDGDEDVRQPRRDERRQHAPRTYGLGELEHQQHPERRREAHRN